MSLLKLGMILAGIVVLGGLFWAIYNAGGSGEREKNLKAANESLRKMEKDDAEIRNLDERAYCREFGFEWLPDKGECG